jgi:NAD(P)-dependent dehydrogenase (short-subunit alcohol dehydrogenase family)
MALRETAAQSLKAGNTAVVTGGASGIGAAIVNILLGKGLRVVIADLAGDKLDAAIRGHDVKSVRLKKHSIMQSIMIVQGCWPMCMRVCHAALLTVAY